MKKSIFLSLFISFLSLTVSAQMPSSKITLPLLLLQDESVAASLSEVSKYLSAKPKGMNYPVSKVKFLKVKGGFSIEVEGIDNSWRNLFKHGDASYGYTIVHNRLFVVMGAKNEEIDLRGIFFKDGTPKSFNKMFLPSTLVHKNPKWYFEYVDGVATKVKEEDLDVLEK